MSLRRSVRNAAGTAGAGRSDAGPIRPAGAGGPERLRALRRRTPARGPRRGLGRRPGGPGPGRAVHPAGPAEPGAAAPHPGRARASRSSCRPTILSWPSTWTGCWWWTPEGRVRRRPGRRRRPLPEAVRGGPRRPAARPRGLGTAMRGHGFLLANYVPGDSPVHRAPLWLKFGLVLGCGMASFLVAGLGGGRRGARGAVRGVPAQRGRAAPAGPGRPAGPSRPGRDRRVPVVAAGRPGGGADRPRHPGLHGGGVHPDRHHPGAGPAGRRRLPGPPVPAASAPTPNGSH